MGRPRLRPPTVPMHAPEQSVYGGPGRPSGYTVGVADLVCHRIACGETLKRICAEDGMPSQSMVYRWLDAYPKFRERFQVARDIQADSLADEALDIARDGNVEEVPKNRLRLDAVRWFTKITNPRKYGDLSLVKHEGDINHNVTIRAKPDADLNADLARMAAKMAAVTDVVDEAEKDDDERVDEASQ